LAGPDLIRGELDRAEARVDSAERSLDQARLQESDAHSAMEDAQRFPSIVRDVVVGVRQSELQRTQANTAGARRQMESAQATLVRTQDMEQQLRVQARIYE